MATLGLIEENRSWLEGFGLETLRRRDDFPDEAKLFYAGRFASGTRNADGLAETARPQGNLPLSALGPLRP